VWLPLVSLIIVVRLLHMIVGRVRGT